ncbi:uncharacterized protein LY79DRAFT_524915 [Colletotrichum navitas]|uniref:Lysine-specific metallo-endopeptidase domain-containing protein n=1 Tax=Colletotrichum navitas TaxID=681940 RepID=A0AAD8PPJ8_9PEZI|nr:uncharacterized protein LY79DRAFT_524915 [Colletotrichum navitas]KAK1573952.1 hypothetical protein LY79DRAFT_524915 [Colletotrichum navitas]
MEGVREAQQLANAASRALRVRGSETSLAFNIWFGKSNASPQMVDRLINYHYLTAGSHLPAPTLQMKMSFEGRARYTPQNGAPAPGLDSLLYVCPSAASPLSDMCGSSNGESVVARVVTTHVANRHRVGPTVLIVCPAFFSRTGPTNAEMVRSYRQSIDTQNFSKGFFLLHELQHMPKATSPDPPAEDMPDPRDPSRDCYSVRCCPMLQHNQKIRNAQNFAFFALDAVAFPQYAKPGSASPSS